MLQQTKKGYAEVVQKGMFTSLYIVNKHGIIDCDTMKEERDMKNDI